MLTLLPLLSLLASPVAMIETWIRGEGNHADDPLILREHLERVPLGVLPTVEVRRFDVQYGVERRYQGFSLARLIERCRPPATVDLALLRFENGMIVPIPFRDKATMARLDPFVARSTRESDDAKWHTTFPEVSRTDSLVVDVRPITFSTGKLVVGDPWHPYLSRKAVEAFSPWRHVDSLKAIEFVREDAYWRQLDVSDLPEAQKGFRIYKENCSFCHGARNVGASMGWDYVDPVALYTYRRPRNLFYHIRYRDTNAPARGLLMPGFKHLTEQDAKAVWSWLRDVANRDLRAYKIDHR